MPQINIRWADNTAELKQRLKEGTGELVAMRAAVEKTMQSLGGQGLLRAANQVTAAIIEMGGAEKLTNAERTRTNQLLEKAIEKYKVLGQTAPAAMLKIAEETRKAGDATSFMEKHAVGATDFMKKYAVAAAPAAEATQKFTNFTTLASKALGAFGVGLGVGAVVSFGKSILSDADALVKMSDKTGISTQGLQKFQIAADDAGNTLDQLTMATNQMQNRLAGGDKSALSAIEKLGLSLADLKSKSPERQFMDIADAIRNVQDPARQVQLAMDIFGRSGAEILPTIKRGFDDVKDAAVGMSEATVKALDRVGDAWQRSLRQTKGQIAEFLVAILPGLERAAFLFRTLAAAPRGGASESVVNTVADLINGPALPRPAGSPNFSTPPKLLPTFQAPNLGTGEMFSARIEKELTEAIRKREEAQRKAAAAAEKQAEADRKFRDSAHDATIKLTGGTAALHKYIAAIPGANSGTGKLSDSLLNLSSASNMAAKDIEFLQREGRFAEASLVKLRDAIVLPMGPMKSPFQMLFPEGTTKTGLTAGFGDLFKTAIPQAIVQSFQGGGSPIKAVGGLLGSQLGTNMVSKFGGSITNLLGKTVGGAVNAILPGIGSLIGPGISALVGGIKKLFGGPGAEELKGRAESADFQKMIADSLTAQQRLAAGGESWKMTLIGVRDAYLATGRSAAEAERVTRDLWNTKNPEAYKRAIREIQGVLDEQKQDQADLQAAIQRYGFSLEQLGPVLRKQKLDEQAKELLNDWRLLVGAGIEVTVVNEKMAASINTYLQTAKKTGTEVPAAMRPIIQTLIDQGRLVDEAGNKFNNLEDTGLTFSETMTEGFDRIVKRLDALLQGLHLIPAALDAIPTDKTIRVDYDYATFDPPGGFQPSFAATGGVVTRSGIQRLSGGGFAGGWAGMGMESLFTPRGSDTVPAMLTPGEVVLNAAMKDNVAEALAGGSGTTVINQTFNSLITDRMAVKRAMDEYLMPAWQDSAKRDVGGVRTQLRRIGQGRA